MSRKVNQRIGIGISVICLSLLSGVAIAADAIQTFISPGGITWELPAGYDNAEIIVAGERLSNLNFNVQSDNGETRPDGYYSYNINATSEEMANELAEMKAAREAGDSERFSRLSNKLQAGDAYTTISASGEFVIKDGQIEEYDAEARELAALEASKANQEEEVTNE